MIGLRRTGAAFATLALITACGRAPGPAVAPVPGDTTATPDPIIPRPAPDTTLGRTPEPPVVVPDPVPVLPDTIVLERAAPRDVRVCAGGDVMLGNHLDTTWALRAAQRLGRRVPALPEADDLLAPLRPLVHDADIVLLNVEGAIGAGPAPPKCRPGSTSCYAFRQLPAAAPALRGVASHAAFVGTVANNHAMDAGLAGFFETVRHLEAAGGYVTGVDTLPTIVVTAAGDSVAFLGFSTFQAGPSARDLAAVRRHVARARAVVPRVVVTTHMGAEGAAAQRTPNGTEMFLGEDRGNSVAFAATAVDAGAAAVIGHGPHVMRAAEWRGDAFVIYSLGNLVTYGPFNLSEPLNRGAIACITLGPDGKATGAALRSTVQLPPGLVRPDPTGRAAFLVDSLSRLDFPLTAGRMFDERVFVKPDSIERSPS